MNLWSKLEHPNVLQLLGYVLEGEYPCLVSRWMDNGTVPRYLTMNPDCDVVRLVRNLSFSLATKTHLQLYNRFRASLVDLNIYMS